MTTPLDQLLAEAIEAMNNLTKAVVERSDSTQATVAMTAASEALDRLKQVIDLEKAAKASKEAAQLAASGAAASKTAAEDAKNTAVGAANAAALSQSAAAESASTATEKANVTTAKADAAAQSAASAGQSASTATSKAKEVVDNAAQVAAAKAAAKASADAALASQQTAEQKATAADTSAQAAQASAQTATQKEQQAKAHADAAAASAQTATTKADETVTNAGAAAQSKADASLSEIAAKAAAEAAAASAQAATAGGIRYDTPQSLSEAGKTQAKANIGLTEMLGAVNGIATLDVAGKVPAAQLPSFVDDVQEFVAFANLPAAGEKGKIYVLETPYKLGNVTSSQFRWSGTAYAPIIASPGSTDSVTEGATNLYFTPARARAAVTDITGNAGTASKLATPRTISATGDINYTVTFDGSGNATAQATLASNDLKAIAGLTGAAGILRKTAAGAWSLDTSAYLTGISSSMVTTALGFTPISSVGSISGNAGTATTLQTPCTINGVSFNGSANIKITDWFHSGRDFGAGTLVTTDINYAASEGDPFVLEIRGNSYGDVVPYDVQCQGYIYASTIINHGGVSNGTNISGLVAINVGGNLCFWWPRQSYWNGFNVRVYVPFGGSAVNRVVGITDTAKPAGTKEVALSGGIRQSLHSGNYTNYPPTTLSGLPVNSSGTNNQANQIVRTDANGYANFGWINTQSGDNGVTSIGRIYASQDGYIRYYTPVNFEKVMLRAVYAREANGGVLEAGKRYGIHTGSGAITMSMPTFANTNNGDEITLNNLHQTWATHAFTITCPAASVKINMLTENLVCNYNAGGFTLVCVHKDATTAFWTVRT